MPHGHHGDLANCGADIFRLTTMPDGRPVWRHNDPDSMAGCRAASYWEGRGWDEGIPRSWTARPLRPGTTPKRPAPPPDELAQQRAAVNTVPPLDDRTAALATLIGVAVRNEPEQLHGGKSPTA